MPQRAPSVGLILAGGGARAAYQVGVLRGISELLGQGAANPFPILCGTSAGAINATALAIWADHFGEGVDRLSEVWETFQARNVYRCDIAAIMRSGAKWLGAMMLIYRRNPISLLDNSPLRDLLSRHFDLGAIARNIEEGHLQALAVTASGYSSGHSVTFYQSKDGFEPWERPQRVGAKTLLDIDHLMASSALPFLFPAVKLHREYFGDGSMRQVAPISPALHLGADRVLVIGTGRQTSLPHRVRVHGYPTMAQVAGHALNSIFLDSLSQDIEWLERINRMISLIAPESGLRAQLPFREVEVLVMAPSQPIEQIASRYLDELPGTIRFLLGAVGALNRAGSNLASYLLFESGFCRALIDLGYRDAKARDREMLAFLRSGN